jgi:hypothetical protein
VPWLCRDAEPGKLCEACRHNRLIPDLSVPGNAVRWQSLELAKHQLLYSLMRWRLPLAERPSSPDGLMFDFVADDPSGATPALTGHNDGVITINLAEADDAEREARRVALGEPYRTVLGHLRHETGHYYWSVLVEAAPPLTEFREVFGNERQDYAAALARHHASGPQAGWEGAFISAYASAHPWEDFAETWAHYMHIVDALETAASFGLRLNPRIAAPGNLAARVDLAPYAAASLDDLVAAWVPLTVAVNAINRSMGQPDLYPFVLSGKVVEKLGFVHRLVRDKALATT